MSLTVSVRQFDSLVELRAIEVVPATGRPPTLGTPLPDPTGRGVVGCGGRGMLRGFGVTRAGRCFRRRPGIHHNAVEAITREAGSYSRKLLLALFTKTTAGIVYENYCWHGLRVSK